MHGRTGRSLDGYRRGLRPVLPKMMDPRFHFFSPQRWLNDPNGLVYFDGEWHLFYQCNPFGSDPAHMSWGHAVSRDLVRWEHCPIALAEDAERGVSIFSGSAAVDWRNTSGFGREGRPPLVAAYTAHTEREQTQHIAFSTDRGRTWTPFSGNPVIAIGSRDFRDPKLFWHAPTQRWVMVCALAAQHRVRFYGSANLRDWQHLSDFGPAGAADGFWECPDLFALPVEGSSAKWILKVDDSQGIGSGSGAQYFIGDFDGATFTCDDPPTRVRPLDYGADFYAAQSWSDAPHGRHVWIAWMSNWAYAARTPTSPWRGMMTIPRELALCPSADGLHLTQQPVAELQQLRAAHHCLADASLAEANAWLRAGDIRGAALEIAIEFAPAPSPGAGPCGLRVRAGAAEETLIGYDPAARQVFVDRSRAGDTAFSPRFDGRHAAPADGCRSASDDWLKLHVFVDVYSVEVFVNDGRASLSELIFPAEASDGLTLFGDGDIRIRSLDVWPLG